MSVRLAGDPKGQTRARLGAGAREQLEKTLRKVIESVPQNEWGQAYKDVFPGVYVSAWTMCNSDAYGRPVCGKLVGVSITDVLVDGDAGKPEEREVASTGTVAWPNNYEAWLRTKDDLPPTWRSPRHLGLLPDAFNAAVSALGVGEVLEKELGLRLEARGVTVKRMFSAESLECAPVVLVDFNVGGKPLTVKDFKMTVWPEGREVLLDLAALVHHGDRKFARRLYMLAWLSWELKRALEEHCREKGYGYYYVVVRVDDEDKEGFYVASVDLWDKTADVACLWFPNYSIKLFDGEHLVYSLVQHTYGDEGVNPVEELARRLEKGVEEARRKSEQAITTTIRYAMELLHSKDPRLKELGTLLAVLIKRAYEEAETAIPG